MSILIKKFRSLWHLVTMCNNYYIVIYHRDIISYLLPKTPNLKLIKSEKEGCRRTHTQCRTV